MDDSLVYAHVEQIIAVLLQSSNTQNEKFFSQFELFKDHVEQKGSHFGQNRKI